MDPPFGIPLLTQSNLDFIVGVLFLYFLTQILFFDFLSLGRCKSVVVLAQTLSIHFTVPNWRVMIKTN